jgi:hypothetical protein
MSGLWSIVVVNFKPNQMVNDLLLAKEGITGVVE